MPIDPLPLTAGADAYRGQARQLLAILLPANAASTIADARSALATYYYFDNWRQLEEWVAALQLTDSAVFIFETAVAAIVNGDITTLRSLLEQYPWLTTARSMRPHQATLLHYTAANGVEDYRQVTPPNIVAIITVLLSKGSMVNETAAMYGGGATTLGLAATSIWPAKAGVLVPLLQTLLDAGAAIESPVKKENDHGILVSCFANGRPEAANFLARHGAMLTLEGAAGVGRLDIVESFFDTDRKLKSTASRQQLESGFIWACQFGHTSVVKFMLDNGVDAGTTVDGMPGLLWAIISGHTDTIQLLLDHKAPLQIKNKYGGDALSAALWAVVNRDITNCWPRTSVNDPLILELLLNAGATIEPGTPEWLDAQTALDEVKKKEIRKVLQSNRNRN